MKKSNLNNQDRKMTFNEVFEHSVIDFYVHESCFSDSQVQFLRSILSQRKGNGLTKRQMIAFIDTVGAILTSPRRFRYK